MLDLIPWLVAMVVLIGCSGFFSASEAALFSLRPADRRRMAEGGTAQKVVASLLGDPERVLSAVLFWNLVVNITYFAIASIVEQRLPEESAWIWPLRIGSLLLIIFFSEMLPKTFAVLLARELAAALSLPLSFLVQLVDPIMPTLRLVMLVSRRLLWPGFEREDSLVTADLERAIELSTDDAKLLDQEQTVLRNIVALSDLRADESMRPRNQLSTFQPPVALAELEGVMTHSGYLFITEEESDNILESVRLESLYSLNPEHLNSAAEPVIYVPWCASLADTAEQLLAEDREVAVVVSEWGDSIGAVTIDDIMDVAFTDKPSRSQRLLNRDPIQQVDEGLWKATSMTNLRRLGEYFKLELPTSHSKTIGGVIQESLQRMASLNDVCQWSGFEFEVVEIDDEGAQTLHIRRVPVEEDEA